MLGLKEAGRCYGGVIENTVLELDGIGLLFAVTKALEVMKPFR